MEDTVDEVKDSSVRTILRMSLVLKGSVVPELRALCKRYDATNQTEMIRRAVHRMYWQEMKVGKGGKLILRHPDGSEETLVFTP